MAVSAPPAAEDSGFRADTHGMGDHLTETLAEGYVLGRVAEPELGRIQEHLLMCDDCRRRVELSAVCVRAIRLALDAYPGNGR